MNAHNRPDQRAQSGFTLTEVMIATFITTIVMASIYGVLVAIINARERLHEMSLRNHVGPTILSMIDEDLQGLFGFNIYGNEILVGIDKSESGMDADSIDFITTTNSVAVRNFDRQQEGKHSDVCEVGYHLRPSPTNSDFLELWRRESFYVDDEPLKGGTYTKLYDRIKSFNIEYFEKLGEDAEPIDEWDAYALQRLPRAIRITISLEVQPRQENDQFISSQEEERRTLTFERVISVPPGIEASFALEPVIPDLVVKSDDKGDGGGDGGGGGKGGGGGGDQGGGGRNGGGGRDGQGGDGPAGGPVISSGGGRASGGRTSILR